MAIRAGHHEIGPDHGRITLRTSRDGLAASAGHDLTIDAARWSGELVVGPDLVAASLKVTVDLGALVVREGTGGIKQLSDRDKREISVTARKVLGVDRYPQTTFTASGFETGPDGSGGVVTGSLALAGQSRPLQLVVTEAGPGRYRATTTVRQTDFGIKPYSALLGSLKVANAVQVEVNLDLSDIREQGAAA